jgi:hypothetical protein
MEHAQTYPTPDVVAVMTQSLMTQQPASPPDVYSIAVMTKSSSRGEWGDWLTFFSLSSHSLIFQRI